ncbi:hypothetical protein T01_15632 [Trichinella spiralis]|uniref:Uncharacterized protein n=1 Tax=Trichinella spiralis TaxID=6334 RepID=A0A0V1BM88_TRISP|nr:hypothetical protein T01_15632 [Trichinella spiralis]
MPTRIWPQLASTTRCVKMAARIKRLHKILLRPIGRWRVRMHVELQSADYYKLKIQYLTTVLLIVSNSSLIFYIDMIMITMSLLYIERLNINSEKQIKTEYSHRAELQNLTSSTTILKMKKVTKIEHHALYSSATCLRRMMTLSRNQLGLKFLSEPSGGKQYSMVSVLG